MGSHQAIMRLLGIILWYTLLCSVWGAPNYHRRYENMQRSLRRPWYKDTEENTDQSRINFYCQDWKEHIGEYRAGTLENDFLCMQSQANIKILSECNDWERVVKLLPTVVDTRASNIYPCEIFDVKLTGRYGNYPDFQYCKILQIDGVLWCTDSDDMVTGGEILSLFPVLYETSSGPYIGYNICLHSMEQYCSPPLLVQFIQPREASIGLLPCATAGC